MRIWNVLSLLTAAGITIAARSPSRVVAAEHVPTVHELSVLCEVCPSDCGLCIPTTEHRVSAGGAMDAGAGNHDCWANNLACDYHDCNVAHGPPVEAIYRMVASESLLELRASLPERNLTYVEERGALQVIADCGSIIAQLPLSRREADALGLD